MWGIGLGWLHPMHTILFLGLTPDHARTEFMGIFIFSQQILAWLPPLVFTILNEVGVPMTIGLASLNVFFAIGLCCLQSMGRYDVLQSMPTSELTVELPAIS
jgi:MFS-type transporter involved in bile tolerance (Atg22 family)